MAIRTNAGEYNSNWSKPSIYFHSHNLRGVHNTPLANIDWGLNYIATYDVNDFAYGYGFLDQSPFNSLDFIEEEGPYAASNNANYNLDARGGTPSGGGKSERQDENWSGKLNIQKPFALTRSLSGFIKAGGKHNAKDRNYYSTGLKVRGTDFLTQYTADHPEIKTVMSKELAMSNFLGAYDPGDFFRGEHPFPITLDYKIPKQMFEDYQYLWRDQVADGLGDYTAEEAISAGYIMSELNFKQRITLIRMNLSLPTLGRPLAQFEIKVKRVKM